MLTILGLCLCATAQSNNADKIYTVGDVGITAPVATFQREPDYTKQARKKKIQGIVQMSVLIGKDGNVENVKLINSLEPSLDENAVKAVQTWKFKPCQKDSEPVRCTVHIEVSYHLY
jgi:TonB family protein